MRSFGCVWILLWCSWSTIGPAARCRRACRAARGRPGLHGSSRAPRRKQTATTETSPGAGAAMPATTRARRSPESDRELCIAVSDFEPDRVKSLLAAGANINARSNSSPTKGMTMLMLAVWHRWDRKIIQLLVDSGADVNAKDDRGNTALVLAAKAQPAIDRAELELLIQAGADVNAKGRGRHDRPDARLDARPHAGRPMPS